MYRDCLASFEIYQNKKDAHFRTNMIGTIRAPNAPEARFAWAKQNNLGWEEESEIVALYERK